MKFSNLQAFQKHLDDASPGHFSSVYMILGKEPFQRKAALDYLVAIVLKGEANPQLAYQVFDAEKDGIDTILFELQTLSFFAKRRVIAIQNGDSFNKAETAKLETYFKAPNKAVCLVILSAAINRATTFYKSAEKACILLDIPEEKPWEKEKNTAEWLRSQAAREGKLMAVTTCQHLVKQLGTDQTLLSSELAKLICYVDQKQQIDDRDIAAICSSVNTETIWQLSDAIFRLDVATSLKITRALLADGVALIALLRQVRSQFQTQFQVCSILAKGGSAANVAQEYPYMKGMILERNMQQSTKYGMARFKKGLLAIDEAELQAKNSSLDPDFIADILFVKLTSG